MKVPYPNLRPVRVELQLDQIDSRGAPVVDMAAETARPMALSETKEPMWYGFVLNDESISRISPGTTVNCTISFINHAGAQEAFERGVTVPFGDGASTKGVLRFIGFD